ncbi:serine hydrolase domain-containing protein [Georgenia deserti]|uniref:Serine hydrolase domain-containing protein n=1 Tax=Georgenia deserti TaxID=2093781 RepID=A0ABW4L3R7_9MICO
MSTRSATANRTMRRALAAAAVLTLPVTTAATASAAPSASVSNPPVDRPDDLSRQVLESAQAAGARTLQRGPGQDTRRDLDAAVDGLVQDGAVGVTARVETPGQEWRGAAGSRELDHAPPAHPQDRFRIGSITKPMVATLVMQEVERGSLSLATPVADILPGLLPDAVGGEVTVEQLLSHRSGAPEFLTPATLARMDDPESVEEFFDVLGEEYDDAGLVAAGASLPWMFEPGTDFSYSNTGYIVLGMMLEELTGRSVSDLLEERVFAPAGMRHTDMPDEPGTKGPFLVGAGYAGEEYGGWYNLDHQDPSLFSSAGAVTSTTRDLDAFLEALLAGDLVAPELVDQMLVPLSTAEMQYGLGVYRVPDPCAPGEYLYGHDGATYGTVSVALSSRDGERQLELGINGRNVSDDPAALYDINEVLVPMMQATC